jgi:hypothetical protein
MRGPETRPIRRSNIPRTGDEVTRARPVFYGSRSITNMRDPARLTRRRRPQHREFLTGYSLAGCSPAQPASASPAAPVYVHPAVRHNQLRCPHFVSPMGLISRSRNQQTACHSRTPSRQSSETEHEGRGRSAGASRHSIGYMQRRSCHFLVPLAGAWLDCRKLARRVDPPGATVPFPVLEAPRRDMCPGGLATADAP